MDNNEIIAQLKDMGFPEEKIQQAIQQTGSNDIGVIVTYIENCDENPQQQQQQQQQQQAGQEGQSISALVNQEDVVTLMSLGHSKNVAEKALLFTDRKGTEAALVWIEEHKNDADFEEESRMVQEKKLTPEEVFFRAKELQQKLRERRKKLEEETALEQERNRIKSGKQMNDVRREIEDQKRRLEMEQQKKDRMQYIKDKEAMEEQLKKEKMERLGQKYVGKATPAELQKKQLQPIEGFELGIKQIKAAQPPDLLPEVAFNSLTLISKILENIIKNFQEPKFRKISLTSQAYTNKIDQVFGAKDALNSLGFQEIDGFYVIDSQDQGLLQKALLIVQNELKQL